MSKLKSYDLVDIQDYRGEVYLKSEADKVIAEKDEEIEELKVIRKRLEEANANLEKRNDSIYNEWKVLFEKARDLNAQVDFLKTTHDACGSCNKCADGMGKVLNKELDKWKKQLRHNKYKRCLAMAEWCEAMRGHYLSYEEPKWFWYRKWSERWLELAEKFKEAK